MNISILSNNVNIKEIIKSHINNITVNINPDDATFLNELFFTKYDLLLIDMTVETASNLIRRLKEETQTNSIPVVYITENFDFTYFQKFGYNLGEVDYLLNPLDKNQLIHKINQYKRSLNLFDKLSNIEDFILQYSQSVIQSQMLGIISHQWRQPLNIIATSVINLELKSELEKLNHTDIENTAQKIHKILEQTTNTINNYNTLFKSSLSKNEFNTIDVYNMCLDLISPQLISHKIKIENMLPTKTILATNYKNELSQTLLSLLSISKDLILIKQNENSKFDGNIKLTVEQNKEQIIFKIVNKKIDTLSTILHNGLTLNSLLKNFSNNNDIKLFVAKQIIENKLNGTLKITNHNKDLVFMITI